MFDIEARHYLRLHQYNLAMLDINEFRVEKGGDPERIRKSQKLRYASVDIVDEVIELDKQWRECTVIAASDMLLDGL